ncbi:hypothetical protein RUND412_000323 [Rhizina undulata]
MATVILGAGIISLSTAHHLSTLSADPIHILESSPHLFRSASGHAAGFLTKDWFSPPLTPLGELSFSLHKALAEAHGGAEKWGYAASTGVSLTFPAGAGGGDEKKGHEWLFQGTSRALAAAEADVEAAIGTGIEPGWIEREGLDLELELLSTESTTAVVNPRELCNFLYQQCSSRPTITFHQPATATAITMTAGKLTGVVVDSPSGCYTLECSRLLLAAGAWTGKVFDKLFPTAEKKIPISSLAGHSLLLRSPKWKQGEHVNGTHALFTTVPEGWAPEIFSRSNAEIYLAGLNSSSIQIPDTADEVEPIPAEIEKLKAFAEKILGKQAEIVAEGLCLRPVTPSGLPVVGKVPDEWVGLKKGDGAGVFVAAGHGPWGISLSLGTGVVVAEMILGRETSVDVAGLGVERVCA